MVLTWRQLAIIVVLLGILAGWSVGLSWILNVGWLPLFLGFVFAGFFSCFFHYQQGPEWMARQLGARLVDSPVLERLTRKAGLERPPLLYVTKPMTGANAFTVSYADRDAIFVTPEIHRARRELQAPILAHELAHIRHNDSFLIGFISAFEQVIGNLGRLWILLLVSGVLGWIVLLLLWPFLLLVHLWSTITLIVYQPLAATLLREREFLADRSAARWTSTDAMKLALKNLEHYNRRWIPRFLQGDNGPLSTHPPLDKRLKRLEENRGRS